MNSYTYTLINIAVYLVSIAAVYHVLYKRFTDTLSEIETEYRLALSRACTSFTDAMTAISKALDTDAEPEQPTLHEWAVTMCRSSGCQYFMMECQVPYCRMWNNYTTANGYCHNAKRVGKENRCSKKKRLKS